MRQLLILIFLISVLSGCSTLGSVEKSYNKFSFSDGIDENEAKIIAQREYLKNSKNDSYKISSAKVYGSEQVLNLEAEDEEFVRDYKIYQEYQKKLKYENSWFVVFESDSFDFLSNYYLVVLDKDKGKIQYTHDSNVTDVIGQVVFTHIKPKMDSVRLMGEYYRDNNKLPENIEQLRNYLSKKSGDTMKDEEALRGYAIQKISDTRVKVKYGVEEKVQDTYNFLSSIKRKLNFKGEFELEVITEDGEIILQVYGDVNRRFTLKDSKLIPLK
jgi:hypothetical protein